MLPSMTMEGAGGCSGCDPGEGSGPDGGCKGSLLGGCGGANTCTGFLTTAVAAVAATTVTTGLAVGAANPVLFRPATVEPAGSMMGFTAVVVL